MASFPDSWVCVGDKYYEGLSVNLGLLPTSGVQAGSRARCLDTSEFYIFSVTDSKWYKQSTGGSIDIDAKLDSVMDTLLDVEGSLTTIIG